jgi:hypothetical protein
VVRFRVVLEGALGERGAGAAEVEYVLEEGGCETKVVHEIAHCVKVNSTS